MEGSRVNANIREDEFQDFDVTYFVNDPHCFTGDDSWLSYFGSILMLQKPEDMELFPAEEEGYSYIILFDDYNKLDLTILDKSRLRQYLDADSLRTVVLDKDGDLDRPVTASDEDYWIRRPSARSFDDCCNEFWNITPYVVKGLCRKEILFAIDHLHLMRYELLRMLSWKVGLEYGFRFSVGSRRCGTPCCDATRSFAPRRRNAPVSWGIPIPAMMTMSAGMSRICWQSTELCEC